MNFNHSNSPKNENSVNFKYSRFDYKMGPEIENYDGSLYQSTRRGSYQNTRMVGSLTIFAFVVLQSWRKSRKEIKQLKQALEDLRKSNARKETQLRVYGTLVRVEQNRTDELTTQLRRMLCNLKRKTSSCESLSMTLSNLRNSQTRLEQEIKTRCEENSTLNEVLAQTKKQLFRSMREQRILHMQLCREQRKVQSLKNEKKILLTEIRTLNAEHRKVDDSYINQLKEKEEEIVEAHQLLTKCQSKLVDVYKDFSFYQRTEGFINMNNEFSLSQFHVKGKKINTLCSIGQRLGVFWSRLIEYPKHTLNRFHILTYFLLPAMPHPHT